MAPEPRKHLREVRDCPHGSVTAAELARLGLDPAAVLDFSASLNPLGAPPTVARAWREVDPSRYPDDRADTLRRRLGEKVGLPAEQVAVGNGSSELIFLLSQAYLDPGDLALVVGPTFGEYERAARVSGARVVEVRAEEAAGFRPDLAAVGEAVRTHRPRLVFLCVPNNPTGVMLGREEIERLLDAGPDSLLVVDEAYATLADDAPDLRPLLARGNLFLLRSLTKDYGLAGLRLGYGLGAGEAVAALGKVRPPWSVNAAAQAAGLAALEDGEHLDRARAVVREARAYLTRELGALGLPVLPSAANFLLVRVGDAAGWRRRLLARGVCPRDGASFGLPAFLRIGVRAPSDCERLVRAFREELAGD